MKKPKTKPIKSYEREGIAIVNPYGDLWSPDIYQTREKAIEAVRRFWQNSEIDIGRYSTVRAKSFTVAVEGDKPEKVKP